MEALLKFPVTPSAVMVVALLAALALVPWTRARSVAAVLASLAGAIYLVFGTGPVAHLLMAGLEHRHYAPDPVPELHHIVVLGAHGEGNPRASLISQVNSHALVRVAEAARLAREHPQALLTVTGAGETPGLMAQILSSLGVSAEQVWVDASSNSTYESALQIERMLDGKTFALVTSAGHMPRAMMVFKGRGLDPIPIPTDHQTSVSIWRSSVLPTPGQLRMSDLAIHEYAALIWYRWRGFGGG